MEFLMSDPVVVFGGSGFIGSHLARSLADAGVRVLIADIVPPKVSGPGISFSYCDVRKPIVLPESASYQAAYNLAAVHRTPGHAPHEYYETNVRGAMNIAAWLESSGVRQLYFTSSISVYGPSEELKTESTATAPTSDYGRSKLLAEEISRGWAAAAADRRLAIIRPAVVFGPGEGGNFTRLADALAKGRFVYPGRKDTIKSCGYVSDLVDALAFVADLPDRIVLANFCYPSRPTIAEICEVFHSIAGYKPPKMVPPQLVTAALAVLRLVNPSDRGSIAAPRVAKLTASTNIAPDELKKRGFTWRTDITSALTDWRDEVPRGAFV
jgi:nucleoside-diphosphate-sugar epimerase